MYKITLLPAILFFFSVALHAQKLTVTVDYITDEATANNTLIYYKPSRLLSWNDFMAVPNKASDAAAITNAGFGFKLMYLRYDNNANLVISVSCNFSKKDSWVKPGNKTAYILKHEQRHFDIAYIHTMMFIHKLKTANFTPTNYTGIIQKIYDESADKMSKMQDKYDTETKNSQSVIMQAEWDKIIDSQLSLTAKL